MMRLGLKLSLYSGKDARGRLLATAAGIALSTCLLLLVLAALNGLGQRDGRRAWLESGPTNTAPSIDEATTDPLLWLRTIDYYGDVPIYRVNVATLGPKAPIPPGIPRLPDPGEYYLSPALSELVASTSLAQIGQRFHGAQIGLIGEVALTSPDALIAIQGVNPDALADVPGAEEIHSIETAARPYAITIQVMLAVGAVGLLFPIVIFIGTSTRLAAASREHRFAALRLVGATPQQVNRLATIEALLAALAGTLIGVGIFAIVRIFATDFSVFGGTFFRRDLTLPPLTIIAVVITILLAAVASSVTALRRMQISPLGVRQQVRQAPPRAWRLLPLLAGFATLALPILLISRSSPSNAFIAILVLGGFGLTLLGIVLAGPWLTMVGSRLLIRLSSSASTLIASRRMADNPAAVFRSVSGLVLAVFVVSVFAGVATSEMAERSSGEPGAFPADAIAVSFLQSDRQSASITPLIEQLEADPGVDAVIPLYTPLDTPGQSDAPRESLMACADVPNLDLGSCTDGDSGVAQVPAIRLLNNVTLTPKTWQPTDIRLDELQQTPLQALFVRTNGEAATQNRVRSAIVSFLPTGPMPVSQVQVVDIARPLILELQRLAYAGIMASVVIAGCSLAVAVVAGILEHKRAFNLLRLAGMPLRKLQLVVVLEATIPLLSAAVVSAALGLGVADLLLRSLANNTLHPPAPSYYLIVGLSLVLALLILALTLPLMRRIAETETVRFE